MSILCVFERAFVFTLFCLSWLVTRGMVVLLTLGLEAGREADVYVSKEHLCACVGLTWRVPQCVIKGVWVLLFEPVGDLRAGQCVGRSPCACAGEGRWLCS
jgi:hypothetical protein